MPKVRYTYRDVGTTDSFSEEDILPPGMDINLRAKQMVMLWNEIAEKSGDPERELVKVEVTDAFLHEHVWVVTVSKKLTGKVDYVACQNCKVEGMRTQSAVTREKKWESNYYEHCHEAKPQLRKPTFK